METGREREELFGLVMRAGLQHQRRLTTVLLATYRVELTQALRNLAHKSGRAAAPARATQKELDHVFELAGQMAAAAVIAKMPQVQTGAHALERSAAAA